MLREIGGRAPVARLGLLVVLKVDIKLEKRRKYMEIVKCLHDLAAVLVFLGIAMTPRAIVSYFSLRGER
jgi:hypothetical protein